MNKNYGIPLTEWGKNCKVSMAAKGITAKKVAETIGLSYNYVSAIINGRAVPSKEAINKISEVLEISATDYNA